MTLKKCWPKKTDIPRQIGFEQLGDCTLKLSKRSRCIRLFFHARNGLTLTSPTVLDDKQIQSCFQQHKHWLEKVQRSVVETKAERDILLQLATSPVIHFFAIPREITLIIKKPNGKSKLYTKESEHQLVFSGATDDASKIRQALRRWLNKKADQLLSPVFYRYAHENGFEPASLSWKTLSSRWGSCTSKKRINLNSKLLFFPMSLVILIFAHELTHLKHLNHGTKFYQALEHLLPDYRLRELNLKDQYKRLPTWLNLL